MMMMMMTGDVAVELVMVMVVTSELPVWRMLQGTLRSTKPFSGQRLL